MIDPTLVLRRLLEINGDAYDQAWPVLDAGVWATWYKGFDNSISTAFPDGTRPTRIRAYMKILYKHGLVNGCHCGCRGDYTITKKGEAFINEAT